ncbi:hypothetical protein NC315_34365 [Streptomyces sp. G2]|uniref:hypothetical protein n=1 Tax=Streptomyces sp. G2 TaxID=1684471 RepID=UPI002030BE09|nr:hypothetical protein [Streptomyces sp. G2]MCM1950416.1 hypothetical protein [Streptomyces sp. G2]
MPSTPRTHRARHLALPARDIAVYDLTHAAFTAALDLALAEWEPFDSFLHHAFTATRLPVNLRPHH